MVAGGPGCREQMVEGWTLILGGAMMAAKSVRCETSHVISPWTTHRGPAKLCASLRHLPHGNEFERVRLRLRACVCVCVRETERERERELARVFSGVQGAWCSVGPQ